MARGQEEFRVWALTNGVQDIVFIPGDDAVVTADHGTTLQIREFPSLALRAEVQVSPPESFLSYVSVSPDGRWLAASRFRDAAIVYEIATMREVARIPGRWYVAQFAPSKPILALIEGDAITAGNPGRLELWDAETRKTVATWPDAGSNLAWSDDGQTIFVSGWQHRISARNVVDGSFQWTVPNTGDVICLAAGGGELPLISSNVDGEVVLWNRATGRRLGQLVGHRLTTWHAAFSPDRRRVATANSDRTVKIWDATTGTLRQTLLGHEQEVWTVVFSPDGTRVVSGDKLGNLLVWRVPEDQRANTGEPYTHLLGTPVWSPDGAWVGFGIGGNQVGLIRVASGRMERRIPEADLPIAFGPDGRTLDVLSRQGVATVPLEGAPVPRGGGYRAAIPAVDPYGAVAVSRDGRWLAVRRGGRDVEVWDLHSGRLRSKLELAHVGDVHLTFSPDGESLGVANMSAATVELFTEGFQRHRLLLHDPLGTRSVAFSPDGRLMASAGMDDRVVLWEVTSGRQVAVFPDHIEGASGVVFSPDGLTVAVISGNRWIQLWSVATHREMGLLEAERYKAFVAFSPDGQVLMAWNPYEVHRSFQFWRAGPNPTEAGGAPVGQAPFQAPPAAEKR